MDLLSAASAPPVVGASTTTRFDLALGRRLHVAFAAALPLLLGGLALFDRGFSYIGVPGSTIFISELVLGLGMFALACTVRPLHVALRLSPVPTALLLSLLLWAGVRTATQVPTYRLDAVRDFAVVYYACFALVIAAAVASRPGLVDELVTKYRRMIPWLLAWSPVAIAVNALGQTFGPKVPGSDVALISNRIGNLEVHLAAAVAFLWLVPNPLTPRRKKTMTTVALILLAAGATQNRGGFVASVLALGVAFSLSGARRRGIFQVLAALGVVATLVIVINPRLETDRRTLSVEQLTENLRTLTGGEGEGDLNNTVAWRDELWQIVLTRSFEEGKATLGWGFGPDLGNRFALGEPGEERPLRSPHNSHLDILARTGALGGLLWGTIWLSWFSTLIRRRTILRRGARVRDAALLEVLMITALAMLVNAYFDPTFESPTGGAWLWVVFGLGLVIPPVTAHRRESPQPYPPVSGATSPRSLGP